MDRHERFWKTSVRGRLARATRDCIALILACMTTAAAALSPGAQASDMNARRVIENMIEGGSSLSDFSAHVSLQVFSGRLAGFQLSGDTCVRKPNEVAFRIGWMTVRPQDSMLFPDPTRFLNEDLYRLSMARVDRTPEGLAYIVQAEPLYPYRAVRHWLFTVDDAQWLIRKAEVVLDSGATSSLAAEYVYVSAEGCFVPSKMTGVGGAFIEEVFSIGWLRSLAGWIVGSDVRYVVSLANHQVNTGLHGTPLD